MKEKIAEIVFQVIEYGVDLQRRLETGRDVDIQLEQAHIQSLLLSEEESQIYSGFGRDLQPVSDGTLGQPQRMSATFLGARYALVCWLDEVFTLNQVSCGQWTERKLEARLFGTNDRAWKFWEQARLAQVRPDCSELEVFYLCVSLGFRGDLRHKPEELRSWVNQAKLRLGRVKELNFALESEAQFQAVSVLTGEGQFRQMAIFCWIALLVMIPTMSFVLIRQFGG